MREPEPCMCGACDCRKCRGRPAVRDEGYDEDDPKHSTWADRQADAADNYRQRMKDNDL